MDTSSECNSSDTGSNTKEVDGLFPDIDLEQAEALQDLEKIIESAQEVASVQEVKEAEKEEEVGKEEEEVIVDPVLVKPVKKKAASKKKKKATVKKEAKEILSVLKTHSAGVKTLSEADQLIAGAYLISVLK